MASFPRFLPDPPHLPIHPNPHPFLLSLIVIHRFSEMSGIRQAHSGDYKIILNPVTQYFKHGILK